MKYFYFGLLLFSQVFLNGCGYHRAYSGPKLADNKISRIISNDFIDVQFRDHESYTLQKINGVTLKRNKAEFLPGRCTVEVSFSGEYQGRPAYSRKNAELEFTALPGETYYVDGSVNYLGGSWATWIRKSGESKRISRSNGNEINYIRPRSSSQDWGITNQ